MAQPLKYSEDLLARWDKRIQIESCLLFFFSTSIGSSFVSIFMFSKAKNPILDVLPFVAILMISCWVHVSKRLCFNTTQNQSTMFWTNAFGFLLWQVITISVCFGSWDEWGWNKDADGEKHPVFDNLFRFVNCSLISCFLLILNYDYFVDIQDRLLRIKFWAGFIAIHGFVAFVYFSDWISIHKEETLVAQVFAFLGSLIMFGAALSIVIVQPPPQGLEAAAANLYGAGGQRSCLSSMAPRKITQYNLAALMIGIVFYWWGSSALNCDFYPDTSDMTLMPGYQMQWIMCVLIVLESIPTMAAETSVLGAQLLADDEYEQFQMEDEMEDAASAAI